MNEVKESVESGNQNGGFSLLEDRTTLNPSTIDVMVDSPSKKRKPGRYKLPSSGNLFLVRVVIYD